MTIKEMSESITKVIKVYTDADEEEVSKYLLNEYSKDGWQELDHIDSDEDYTGSYYIYHLRKEIKYVTRT